VLWEQEAGGANPPVPMQTSPRAAIGKLVWAQQSFPAMKQIWTGRAAQVVGKYGEHAPTAAVCCNACRTCVTTNLIGLATAAAGAVGYEVVRLARRARLKGPPARLNP